MPLFDTHLASFLDQILNDLDAQGFSIIDDVYASDYMHAVSAECLSQLDAFRAAGIQNGVMSQIRSDHILWINDAQPIAQQHIQALDALGKCMNRAFFTGIKDVEAHFACYRAGEFYALHRDNPQGKNGRIMSSVYYLHDQWQTDWGGQLHLQDKHDQWHMIEPRPNRLAIFQSDLLHEVKEAHQQRLSITAWLRSDQQLI